MSFTSFVRRSESPVVSLAAQGEKVLVAAGQVGRRISVVNWSAGNVSYRDVTLTFYRRDAGSADHVVAGPYALPAFGNSGINISGDWSLFELPPGESLYAAIDEDLAGSGRGVASLNVNLVRQEA